MSIPEYEHTKQQLCTGQTENSVLVEAKAPVEMYGFLLF